MLKWQTLLVCCFSVNDVCCLKAKVGEILLFVALVKSRGAAGWLAVALCYLYGVQERSVRSIRGRSSLASDLQSEVFKWSCWFWIIGGNRGSSSNWVGGRGGYHVWWGRPLVLVTQTEVTALKFWNFKWKQETVEGIVWVMMDHFWSLYALLNRYQVCWKMNLEHKLRRSIKVASTLKTFNRVRRSGSYLPPIRVPSFVSPVRCGLNLVDIMWYAVAAQVLISIVNGFHLLSAGIGRSFVCINFIADVAK